MDGGKHENRLEANFSVRAVMVAVKSGSPRVARSWSLSIELKSNRQASCLFIDRKTEWPIYGTKERKKL